jgi:hypothetical protein
MSATSVTLRGRAAAERLMVDACVIKRPSGSTSNPDTGEAVASYTTIYTGQCRLQQSAPSAGGQAVGGATVYQVPYQLQIPVTAPATQVEDIVTMTACGLDAEMVGRTFWIKGTQGGSHKTARRLPLEQVTG